MTILKFAEPKYSKEPPEIWPEIEKRFGVKWGPGVAVTYAGVIHCEGELAPDADTHEFMHVQQQAVYKDGPRAFFDRFMTDRDFREEMEVEAFRTQWTYIRQYVKDRNDRARALEVMAGQLAGPMYDLGISTSKARHLISRAI
jgi:hypothetical protein